MSRMRNWLTPFLAFSFFTLGVVAAPAAQAAEKLVVMGTGVVTGVYYPAGGAICRFVNGGRRAHGIRCTVVPTGGSINNLEGIRELELDLAVVQSDWLYHAYKGSEVFADQGPNPKLRVLFSLHSEPFTIVARRGANINSFEQLKGKRVNIGNPGSGMRATMEELMKLKGWTSKTFADISELKAADQVQALCSGKIDAIVYAVGHPNAPVQELTSKCDAHLIGMPQQDVNALIQQHPFYAPAVIPGGLYAGNPKDIKTFGVKAVLVASEDLDNEIAYQIVKSVFDNLDNFKTLHSAFTALDATSMARDAASIAPLHEGAERYLKEKGLIQ